MGRGCGCVGAIGCLMVGVIIGAVLVWFFYPRFQQSENTPETIEMREIKAKARSAIDAVPDTVRIKNIPEEPEVSLPEAPADNVNSPEGLNIE